MGMGIATLVSGEWELECLDGNGREWKLYIFPISSPCIADHQILLMDPCFGIVFCPRLLGFTLDVHETLFALTLRVYFWRFGWIFSSYNSTVPCLVELTGHLLSDRDTTRSTGMGAGGNGNNRWEWEGNGDKTRLNLGSGMGMNHWEWKGMGLKKTFPLTSNAYRHNRKLTRAPLNQCSAVHYIQHTSHQTHYKSYIGDGFFKRQLTQPTVSKHWRKTGS